MLYHLPKKKKNVISFIHKNKIKNSASIPCVLYILGPFLKYEQIRLN